MQVKKFEAATLQEAIENVKRDLGPDAIILQTKRNRKGLGLLSKSSVEVTAAVSEQALARKTQVDRKLPADVRSRIEKLSTPAQMKFYQSQSPVASGAGAGNLQPLVSRTQDRVELSNGSSTRRMTTTQYVDIPDVQTSQSGRVAPKASPREAVRAAPAVPTEMRELKGELVQLREQFREMIEKSEKTAQSALSHDAQGWATVALQEAFDHLVVAGLDRKTAWKIVKEVQFKLTEDEARESERVQDAVAQMLVQETPTVDFLDSIERKHEDNTEKTPSIVILIGATGVGKTTTLAKLASDATIKRHLKVGLINADRERVGAFDQLATYAKILGLPFRSVHAPEDLSYAVKDMHQCDLILVDTAGYSQRDNQGLAYLEEVLAPFPIHHTHLVVSATTRDVELQDIGKRFSRFKPESIIFTKLDEAVVHGGLFQLPQRLKLPLSYFAMGQKVPEDLERASPERVAALMLDIV